ncbi:hypothetical protein XENORESO_001598, partial [Xenotaenia resolanae]
MEIIRFLTARLCVCVGWVGVWTVLTLFLPARFVSPTHQPPPSPMPSQPSTAEPTDTSQKAPCCTQAGCGSQLSEQLVAYCRGERRGAPRGFGTRRTERRPSLEGSETARKQLK